jgi:hypothetical protein
MTRNLLIACLLIAQYALPATAQKMGTPKLPTAYTVEAGYKEEPEQPGMFRKGFRVKKGSTTVAWIVCAFTDPASRAIIDANTETCEYYALAYISESRDGTFEQTDYNSGQSLEDIVTTFLNQDTYAGYSEEQRQYLLKPLADPVWITETSKRPAVTYARPKNWAVDATGDLNPFSNALPDTGKITTLLFFDNNRSGAILAFSIFPNSAGYKSIADAESAYAAYWRAIHPTLQEGVLRKYGALEFKRWVVYAPEQHQLDGMYLAVFRDKLVSLRTFGRFTDIEAVNVAAEKFLQSLKLN